MDGYPQGSLDHNVPFLVASGLSSEDPQLDLLGELASQGQLVKSSLSPLDTRESRVLRQHLRGVDNRGQSWVSVSKDEPYRLRVKVVGRSYLLPPRKAKLPDTPEPPKSAPMLHSPFSPLSHVSTLYPDGLIGTQWIKKHQDLVPSLYVCFYLLKDDKRLKTDVSEIKATFARSGYKTRVAVVLLGDADDGTADLTEEVQDRIETIRRGTALDPKSIFYIAAQESKAELTRVFDTILSALFAATLEYYRDLGRHARKKRSRGLVPQPTLPPTSGTSQTLSLSDWNFRYDFKTAMLAEFRHETDVAIRSFEQAYELLLGQDILELIPSWSPRWNEARQLADIISIRCLRLHLWMGQTSLAVRRWQIHRDRIGDFVDRRGHGTNTYGWQAWEARWATVMATLIERVEVPGLVPASATIFLSPEKAVSTERLQPWEHLHHAGYWHRIAARHLAARRTLAYMMPEEDRQAPSDATVKKAASIYDTYMCPPPHEEYPLSGDGGVNHAQEMMNSLMASKTQFQARKQWRAAAELSLECAKEMASSGSWEEALATLHPIWDGNVFTSANWLDVADDFCWLLRRAAQQCGEADLVVSLDWEMMHSKFPKRRHWHYDLSQSLDGMLVEQRPSVHLSNENASALISSSFVFRHKEGKVGDYCQAQVVLESNAMPGSVPFNLSSVRIEFTGSLKPIAIRHEAAEQDAVGVDTTITEVELAEGTIKEDSDMSSELSGHCDLTFEPGRKRVLNLMIPLRESGDAQVSFATLTYSNTTFDLKYTTRFKETDAVTGWRVEGSRKPRQLRTNARYLHIEPRPPKLQMTLLDAAAQYYTGEVIELRIEIRNEEEDAASVKLSAQLFGQVGLSFRLRIGDEDVAGEGGPDGGHTAGITAGNIASGAAVELRLTVNPSMSSTSLDLHIGATYHLSADPATPILQALPLQLNMVSPFEANYDLVPRLHADPWPSLFDYEPRAGSDAEGDAKGLAQQWCLLCHYASFASEDLVVTGLELQVPSCTGATRCTVVTRPTMTDEAGIVVSPKMMQETQFDLVVQKPTLDDTQAVMLELAFVIRWKRTHDSERTNTTVMPVGQYSVLGTEPRVLATVLHSDATSSPPLIQLHLTIENPSNHFLTFGVVMDPSDKFGFSGPKQTTLHLLPLTRRTVQYRLLPYLREDYIRPGLTVRDKYFQKVLRIIPTEGMKIDKDGLLVWVPAGGDAPDR